MSETVKVIDLVNALQLEIITGDEEALQREIKISDISRPGGGACRRYPSRP